jgi:cell division protein ZapE
VLLATSNYPPSGLLPNPLYHHLFEPTTTLIESTMDIVELLGDKDYRSERGEPRSNFERGRYSWPSVDDICPPPDATERRALPISGRTIQAPTVRDGLVW